MTTTINASTTAGLVQTADTSGVLALQTAGTTAVSISASQVVTVTNDTVINGITVGKGGGAVSTNTAVGVSALAANQAGGTNNTAIGNSALDSNTTGDANTAVGDNALQANTTASNNTAVGYQAGYSQTTSPDNVFMGNKAGYSTSTGSGSNTFIGQQAGYSHTTGQNNQFFGGGAGYYISTGSKNSILGAYSGNQGGLDIRTSSNHIVLSDGDGNPRAYWNASGHVFFPLVRGSAGTYAARFTGSLELTVDTSSARYKDNIRDSIYGLADLLKIQSRQFEYKDDGRSDVGFIAEEMVEVIPEVVAIDKQGRPDAVSYDRLVSVCVKAIQELKTIVDAQAAEIAELKAKVA